MQQVAKTKKKEQLTIVIGVIIIFIQHQNN